MKLTFKDNTHKKKWIEALTIDIMSSEESCEDEDLIVVRPLKWRSQTTEKMLKTLDDAIQTNRSGQSKRQLKRRSVGEFSNRERPDDLFTWL